MATHLSTLSLYETSPAYSLPACKHQAISSPNSSPAHSLPPHLSLFWRTTGSLPLLLPPSFFSLRSRFPFSVPPFILSPSPPFHSPLLLGPYSQAISAWPYCLLPPSDLHRPSRDWPLITSIINDNRLCYTQQGYRTQSKRGHTLVKAGGEERVSWCWLPDRTWLLQSSNVRNAHDWCFDTPSRAPTPSEGATALLAAIGRRCRCYRKVVISLSSMV